MEKVYVSIDLKSFFASVECKERDLDPLTTNLVVADPSRTEKTICLAVSPSLKSYGIPGRARLFEVIQKVKNVNNERIMKILDRKFKGKSYNNLELKKNPFLELDYIIAPPRMSYYIKYSTQIYNIYLKYVSAEDIFAYSIDEVFCDITKYLKLYKLTPEQMVTKMIKEVYETTGITATAGIGTNMFLCKVAMDVVAKHTEPNEFGVRIAVLDEMEFRRKLWNHEPITDIWRVGRGYAKRLAQHRMYTMGDVARCSIENEDLLYKLFGINAELLIDHSWGWEPTTIKEVKEYKPEVKSLSSGQVLHCPYDFEKSRIIVKEMAELLSLEMVEKHYITDQLVLDVIYDIDNLTDENYSKYYNGEITIDRYGRKVPKPAHGTYRLENKTSSSKLISEGFVNLYNNIVNHRLLIRKINICSGNLSNEYEYKEEKKNQFEQINLFTDYKQNKKEGEKEVKEHQIQETIINIKRKYGKNAILKGIDLEEGATTIDRNKQIGGHSE